MRVVRDKCSAATAIGEAEIGLICDLGSSLPCWVAREEVCGVVCGGDGA